MTSIAPYLYVLDGRWRIKPPQVTGAPQRALAVEEMLRGLDGVTNVTANPTTGNVLVLFTSAVTSPHTLIAALRQTGYLRDAHTAKQSQTSLMAIVMHAAME
jgi:copper chaperone CopZ